MKRFGPTCLVIALLFLAGCQGPTTQAPAFPDGYSEQGVNATAAESLHTRHAIASGSMTVTIRTNVTSSPHREQSLDRNISTRQTYQLDFRNQTLYTETSGIDAYEGYYNATDGWMYVRSAGENPEYTMRDTANVSSYATPTFDHGATPFTVLRLMNFTYTGTQDGRLHYTATTITADDPTTTLAGFRVSDLGNVSATLIVDQSGRLREFTFTGDVYRTGVGTDDPEVLYTYSVRVTASDYGATTPRVPEWLPDARAQYAD